MTISFKMDTPSASPSYSDGDMERFMKKYAQATSAERYRALRAKMRNMSIGATIQFILTFICLCHGANYALQLYGGDGGASIGGWVFTVYGYVIEVPQTSFIAAGMVLGICGMIASTTYFSARMPEMIAQFKTGANRVETAVYILVFIVAICLGTALSIYSSANSIQISAQTTADAGEIRNDRSVALEDLKSSVGDDLKDAEYKLRLALVELETAENADSAYVRDVNANFPEHEKNWAKSPHKNSTRRPHLDAIERAQAQVDKFDDRVTILAAQVRSAAKDYAKSLAAPNSVEKALSLQGQMFGGISSGQVILYTSFIVSGLIDFFRVSLSLVSQTSLMAAIVGFATSEASRKQREANKEAEAEDSARRYEEAMMAPVQAQKEAHIRVMEAKAGRIVARTKASVEAIEMDEEPDDFVPNTDSIGAIADTPAEPMPAAPTVDELSIRPMPSERAQQRPLSALMAVTEVVGYAELTPNYQDVLRRSEKSWREGNRPTLTHSALERDYGIKNNKARGVFLEWLEKSGRATCTETPTGRKYSKAVM